MIDVFRPLICSKLCGSFVVFSLPVGKQKAGIGKLIHVEKHVI